MIRRASDSASGSPPPYPAGPRCRHCTASSAWPVRRAPAGRDFPAGRPSPDRAGRDPSTAAPGIPGDRGRKRRADRRPAGAARSPRSLRCRSPAVRRCSADPGDIARIVERTDEMQADQPVHGIGQVHAQSAPAGDRARLVTSRSSASIVPCSAPPRSSPDIRISQPQRHVTVGRLAGPGLAFVIAGAFLAEFRLSPGRATRSSGARFRGGGAVRSGIRFQAARLVVGGLVALEQRILLELALRR